MNTIKRSALVPYSAQEMFDLVSDIGAYGEFLPWCGGARVLSRDEHTVVASIEIAYKGLHKAFTTRNQLFPGNRMEMRLVQGPFSHLEGQWTFQPLGERASKISLDLQFEFSSRLAGLAMGPVFGGIANSLVDSFRRRAAEVYGVRDH